MPAQCLRMTLFKRDVQIPGKVMRFTCSLELGVGLIELRPGEEEARSLRIQEDSLEGSVVGERHLSKEKNVKSSREQVERK